MTAWRITGSRFIVTLLILATCLVILAAWYDWPVIGIDDANIFFVYARHLAAGHGFVYNVGGEQVEGFSSLLWVLVCTGFYVLRPFFEPGLLTLLTAITAVAFTAFVSRIHDRFAAAEAAAAPTVWSVPAVIVVAWLFGAPALTAWCTLTLMDTGLWVAVLLAAGLLTEHYASLSRRRPIDHVGYAGMMAVLIVTRPEAPAWILALAAASGLIVYARSRQLKSALAAILPGLAGGTLALALLTGFRLAVFGFPFPNTFYAKVSPDRWHNIGQGLHYATEFLTSNVLIVAGVMAAILHLVRLAGRILRQRSPETTAGDMPLVTVASVMTVTGLVIPILVGGDHFGAHRFYQPVWPWLIVPILPLARATIEAFLRAVPSRQARLLAVAPLAILMAVSNEQHWGRLDRLRLEPEFSIPANARVRGHYIEALFADSDYPTLGVVTAGGIKYTYPGFVYDLMGLNNVEMAHHAGDRRGFKNHASFDRAVFLRQQPDIVRPGLRQQLPTTAFYLADRFGNRVLNNLFHDPEINTLYTPVAIRRTDLPQDLPWLIGFTANTLIERLRDDPTFEVRPLPE